jgi:hypothetical protein
MGTSYTDARYTINGTVLTENTVMDNMAKMANSCGCWITYDVHQGKWAVIINRAGTSQYSFDDSNIIGPINLSNTGIDTLYNSMKATFMHEDLDGQTDFVQIEVPSTDQFPNETPNELSLTYDLVTDPVQAQLLGFIELKQSRVDKVISFKTDYSKIGVKAGDIIDVANTVYSFVADLFRVISVREVDNQDGGIDVEIMALDYDASVYDESNLNRYVRTGSNGLFDTSILPAPRIPDIIKYEDATVPRITATTSLVGGLVDEVEYWVTEDVPPAVSNDDDRTYHMLTTAVPPTSANVFVLDESITVDVADMDKKNFLIKCRAKNAFGVSPYSDPSGLIEYDPKPVAGNISANGASSISDTLTGVGGMFSLSNGVIRDAIIPYQTVFNPSNVTIFHAMTITPGITGKYIANFLFDQNTSGARGGRGSTFGEPKDYTAVQAELLFHGNSVSITGGGSGGDGTFYWTDFNVVFDADLVAGVVYRVELGAMTYTESSPTVDAKFDASWNICTVGK